MGIHHATPYTLRGGPSTKLERRSDSQTHVLHRYQDNEKELWDSRKHQTGKETGGEGMPKGGHQPSTNMGGNLPLNGMLLSHHAHPFIPSSLHIPTILVPIPVNPYYQPFMNLVNGQALNFPFQTQIGNPLAGGTYTYHPQGGYIPQAFTNNSVPSYNRHMHPTVTPSSSYPFYTQPMYAPPNMPVYPNPVGSFADSTGSVTPFVHWIEDYPLPDGPKMPSHIGSYDGKGDPDNFLHLFEEKTGSILNYKDLKAKSRSHFSQQKKFTKTHLAVHNIKQREGESTRTFITRYTDDTLQILGLHEEQRISGFVHGLRTRSLVEHLSIDLPSTYKGLMKKTYMWVEAREVATNGASSIRRDSFESLKEILATEKTARSFEPPPKMFGSKRSRDMSKYCHFHEDYGHDTNDCRHLRIQIQEGVNSGQLSHLVKGIKKERIKSSDTPQGESKKDKGTAPAKAPILMVNNAPVIIEAKIFGRKVGRVYMDSGSSCEIIYEHCFEKLNPTIKATKVDLKTPLVGFSGEHSWSIGEVPLEITIGDAPLSRIETLNFVIVRSESLHNMLLGRTAMQRMGIVVC
ncbi:reverse transcriptase domain-containing protein [Tanacetum coccineum]|uniref:Reverse transcriptase domain-containing protein n=1 Tax=Tanacetum coccineum TaxID=301880 RepID=A0ABQ5IL80_9ASTR